MHEPYQCETLGKACNFCKKNYKKYPKKLKCRICNKFVKLDTHWYVEIINHNPGIQGGSPPPKDKEVLATWHWNCFRKKI